MTIPTTMRAVVLTGHGGLEKLEYRDDVPVPAPGPDEVLIEVAACGMNNTDVNTRTGWYSKSVSAATGAAMTDTGVDGSHPALASRWRGAHGHPASECWLNLIDNGHPDFPYDGHDHGTRRREPWRRDQRWR